MIDWSKYSTNLLKASTNGAAIGRNIASKIIKNCSNLHKVHVVGVSVGAFAADAFIAEVGDNTKVKRNNINIYQQLTLLDPFCQKGVVGFYYGKRRFGKIADYAQQYLNTVSLIFLK